jgi:hypothetical protein
MSQQGSGKGWFALDGRQTGPEAGDNLLAHEATARIATANISKQAGIGLRCGTHGKTFHCTVCVFKRKKTTICLTVPIGRFGEHRSFCQGTDRATAAPNDLSSLASPPEKVK